ncbi:MAG: transposase [Planctomycetota bacterium]
MQRRAEALETPVNELAVHVKTQHVHVDETGWRQGGQGLGFGSSSLPLVTLFRIARHRSGAIAKELLGEDYPNSIAICDRYRAYHWIDKVQLLGTCDATFKP